MPSSRAKGEPTALITTEGFRDVLELARIRTPHLYDLYYQKPPPLVQRDLRFEVSERTTFSGEVLKPLDPDSLAEAVDRVAASGVKSVAIALLHSYANAGPRGGASPRPSGPACPTSVSRYPAFCCRR